MWGTQLQLHWSLLNDKAIVPPSLELTTRTFDTTKWPSYSLGSIVTPSIHRHPHAICVSQLEMGVTAQHR